MNFFATLALLAATATAGPTTKTFTLQTSGASNTSLNGLYLTTRSTGPLNSLAVFTGGADEAATFYLANGTVRYQAENNAPWELALISEEARKAAVEVSVSPTTGGDGFSFASDGDLETSNKRWGGWLACTDDALYYINAASSQTGNIAGCDHVELQATA